MRDDGQHTSDGASRVPLGLRLRTFTRFRKMDSRLIPKAHAHDPRNVPKSDPRQRYADLVAQWRLKADWKRHGMTSLREWQQTPAARALDYPLQVKMAGFSVLVALPDSPALLIPRNKNRYSLSLSVFTNPVAVGQLAYYSFGTPLELEAGLIGGLPLPVTGPPEKYSDQAVPIDDIFVWTRTANPIYIVGYEGTIAAEANQS